MEFHPMPKIARLFREVVVTEKIDGTNASIYISDDGTEMRAASRTRWLDPGTDDNFGFRAWMEANRDELLKLGPGHHFGEWWGGKIQRGYGLKEKRFSLFNIHRWGVPDAGLPACVSLVPVMWRGEFSTAMAGLLLNQLQEEGSLAAPGFMQPEGIVVYHRQGNILLKATLGDDEHKGV